MYTTWGYVDALVMQLMGHMGMIMNENNSTMWDE
jgi:hypothetical protein